MLEILVGVDEVQIAISWVANVRAVAGSLCMD